MATVARIIDAPADRVFSVLADGWTYSDWVVGTVHIRDVDETWPQPGSQLHHKAGPWPFSLHDSSTVTALVPGRRLELKAGLWPLGRAAITIELTSLSPSRTRVVMHETFDAGPLVGLRNKVNDLVLHQRNVEALRRLADIAVRRPA